MRVAARHTAALAAARRLPDIRGRNRLCRWIAGTPPVRTSVTFGPGLTFTLDRADIDQNAAWYFQFQPPSLAPLLDVILRAGDTFIDVGANIGTYSCWAGKIVGPTGSVHAYEPVETTRAVLLRHITDNHLTGTVTIHPHAVGDQPGEMTLYTVPGASGHTASYPRHDGSAPTTVPVVTLDTAVLADPRPRLLKVDVEGYETPVLRGAHAMLTSSHPPVVVVECCDALLRRARSTSTELLTYAAALGYQPWQITHTGIHPIDPTQTVADANIVLLHPGHHAHETRVLATTRFPRNYTT